MDNALKRLIDELSKRTDLLSRALAQSQRPKETSWVQNLGESGTEIFLFTLLEDMADGGHSDISQLNGTPYTTNVVVEDTLNDFTHLLEDEEGICVKANGAYYAIHPEAAAAKALVAFDLTTDLTTSGSATVTFTTNITIANVGDGITVLNPTGELAYSGASGVAVKIGASWYAIEVNRPDGFLQVTFSCASHDWTSGDSARGFTADQTATLTVSATTSISSYPVNFVNSITISNPYNLNWISGDRALLRKHDDNDYIVVKVLRQKCLSFRFALSANAPSGLAQTITSFTVICPVGSESGEPPTSPTLKDTYSKTVNAKSGHKGIAEYDWNHDWYVVTECEHICTRFRGTIYSSLSGGASTIQVVPVVPFDGKGLPSFTTSLTVYNTHGWETGDTGAVIRCEWNPIDEHWEAYQMDCPA